VDPASRQLAPLDVLADPDGYAMLSPNKPWRHAGAAVTAAVRNDDRLCHASAK